MKFINNIIFSIVFLFIVVAIPALSESAKVMSLTYDNSSSLIFIGVESSVAKETANELKVVRLNNPNRVYFDIKPNRIS